MLPFSPLPLSDLQARAGRAFEHVFTDLEMARGHSPFDQPENCFDFEDGMRLVILRIRAAEKIVQQVCAMIARGTAWERAIQAEPGRRSAFLSLAYTRAVLLEPRLEGVELVGEVRPGVAYWLGVEVSES